MTVLTNTLVFLATLAGMELFAWWAHKYVMHGWGWGWHKSHHEPRSGWFEKNDLYAVVFAGVAILLIALGTAGYGPLEWIGAGMTAYGFLYFVAHDGLVHHRWPLRYVPRNGYLNGSTRRIGCTMPSKARSVAYPSVSSTRRRCRCSNSSCASCMMARCAR